jgi:Ca2+-transporting ATPase
MESTTLNGKELACQVPIWLFMMSTLFYPMLRQVRPRMLIAVFAVAHYSGRAEEEARALTFTTLVLSNLALILTNRSWGQTILGGLRSPNPAPWWVVGGTLGFLGFVIYAPLSRALFRFSILHLHDIAICLGAAILSIVWFEVFKVWRTQRI